MIFRDDISDQDIHRAESADIALQQGERGTYRRRRLRSNWVAGFVCIGGGIGRPLILPITISATVQQIDVIITCPMSF